MEEKKFKNLKIRIAIVNAIFIICIIISMLFLFMLVSSIRTHEGINNANSWICLGLFILSLGVVYLINLLYEVNYKRVSKLFLQNDHEITYSIRYKHSKKNEFKQKLNIKTSRLQVSSVLNGNIASTSFTRIGGNIDFGNGKKKTVIYIFDNITSKEMIINSTNIVLRQKELPLLRKEKGYDIYSKEEVDESYLLKKSEPYILIHHNKNAILFLLDDDKFKLKDIKSSEDYSSLLIDEKKEIKALIKFLKKE